MKRLLTIILLIVGCQLTLVNVARAQSEGSLSIQVDPAQDILPPEIGDYKANPGKYFNVRLTNLTSDELRVYLAVQIEQTFDNDGRPTSLSLSSPPTRMPSAPIIVPAQGSTDLSMEQMRRIFDHIPLSEMQFDTSILGSVAGSDFGLLPEGYYRVRLTAYKWDPLLLNAQTGRVDFPVAYNNPDISGFGLFRVCYRAQAPVFTIPSAALGTTQLDSYEAINFPLMNPVLAWSEPTMNCWRETYPPYQYTLTVREIYTKGEIRQTPDQAILNPILFEVKNIMSPQCMLDYSAIQKLLEGHLYVVQVEATPIGAIGLNFAMVENQGKSPFIVITPQMTGDYPDISIDEEEETEEDEEEDLSLAGITTEIGDDDALYVFRNPELVKPDFNGNTNNTLFAGNTLNAEWKRPLFAGGAGEQQDTLKFRYRTQIYSLAGYATKELALEQEPVYDEVATGESGTDLIIDLSGKSDEEQLKALKSFARELGWLVEIWSTGKEPGEVIPMGDATRATLYYRQLCEKYKDIGTTKAKEQVAVANGLIARLEGGEAPELSAGVDVLLDNVRWELLSQKVSVGQALLLRVVPECINQESVRFYDDVNELAFMYSDKLSEAFGNACAGGVIEENRKPGKFDADEVKGMEVFVGEYVMTMGDDVKQDSKTQGWSGTGWMLWEPGGQKVKVGVKFKNIFINDDRIMYDGVVQTETKSNWQHIKERAKAYANKYSDTSELGDWIPDDIFTEWGLDNLVGYATPEELKNTLAADVGSAVAQQQANGLAAKVKASKYYDYVRKGYAIYDNFQKKGAGGFPDVEVFMPLEISDLHKTPVDVQIMSMEFYPTYAWMNLLGMFSLPDNDITEDNILMFGAPRICMDPDQVLPGSGYVTLLSDVTLNDPNSSFKFTFKAPKEFQEPKDGCFLHWEADTLSGLSLEAQMEIPGLLPVRNEGSKFVVDKSGTKPKFTVQAFVKDWDDWMASVSMDPFTHDDVKGWTFLAKQVTYDHSQTRNPAGLTFPTDKGYNKEDAGIVGDNDLTWEGLFVKELDVQFPAGFINKSNAFLSATDMIVDPVGVTLQMNVNRAIDAEWGGWELKLNHIFMNVVQNNFKDCGFDGSMHVPLMKENMAFKCNMYPIEREDGTSDFDCILKCTDQNQLNNISFDFFLAELVLDRKQTYFLLESRADLTSESGARDNRVELCMGGDITIGGASTINQNLDYLLESVPLKLHIPGIHFTQMRIANCERWIADEKRAGGKEIAEMQKAAVQQRDSGRSQYSIYEICDQNTYKLGEHFYFERGWWSVASVEKNIGPFKFGIKKFNITADTSAKTVGLGITGRAALMDKGSGYDNNKMDENALVCADLSFEILCDVDVARKELKYKDVLFKDISLNANFCGVTLEGGLKVGDGTSTEGTSKGYAGNIKVTLPGNLLYFEAMGGFFEHSAGYKWGYVYAGAGGKMGIQITPLTITKIGAGIYFNCYSDATDKTKVKPKKGLIGVMADLGLASSDGELISGDFHMSVLYDRSANGGKGRLTTFLFTGDCKAVGGIIDSKVTIHWQNDDADKYFQLTATMDASADGGTILNALGQTVGASEIASQMKLLNDKWESAKGAVTGSLQGAMGDDSKDKADKTTNANMKDVNAEKSKGPKMGAHASLDLKLTFRENGQNLSKCKWHVYLGEPEEKKRCSFTLIDFKSAIVSVNIGANFYFCVGNELPNNGQLPEIPKKIRDFLNGQSVGGMEGADMTKANNARQKALRMFSSDAEICGGVMVGASEYGYVDVDLGIFYGDMGAVAGFDVTLAKLKHTDCPGYGVMGYKGWYAEGQLYAYLYAKFGIHVDLGFWDKKFDIIDAGIGGVLKAGLPHPSYFVGDARIKMKLLGGLVNINRRFQFECGHVCNIWYGNPLDNFELFGDCSIGSANVKEGWAKDAELVSPTSVVKPRYYTQAPINEHFRVLDENTLHDLAENYHGDMSELEMQSKRTFVFRHTSLVSTNNKPILLEYAIMPDTTGLLTDSRSERTAAFSRLLNTPLRTNMHYLTQKAVGQTSFMLDDLNNKLRPGYYYVLVVQGNAKEIIKGNEENPKEYNEKTHKWEQKEWKQVQFYFFKTDGATPKVADDADLEPYVALAYPSEKGQIRSLSGFDSGVVDEKTTLASQVAGMTQNVSGSGPTLVYLTDANNPNIALTQQLFFIDSSGKRMAHQGYPYSQSDEAGGQLLWLVSGKRKSGTRFTKTQKASFITGTNSQNIVGKNLGWQVGDEGTLALVYRYNEYVEREVETLTGFRTESDNEYVWTGGEVKRESGLKADRFSDALLAAVAESEEASARTRQFATTTDTQTTGTIRRLATSSDTDTQTTGTKRRLATMSDTDATSSAIRTSSSTRVSLGETTSDSGSDFGSTGGTYVLAGARLEQHAAAVAGSGGSGSDNHLAGWDSSGSGGDHTVAGSSSGSVIELGDFVNPHQFDQDYSPEARDHHTSAVYEKEVAVDTIEHFKILYALNIKVVSGDWTNGYTESNQTRQLDYSKPYVGMRLTEFSFDYTPTTKTDAVLVDDPMRLYDPYYYLSYLGNYFFIGGHGIKNYSFTDNEDRDGYYVPVAESMIYYTKGGQTSGNFSKGSTYNIQSGRAKISNLSVGNPSYDVFGQYVLPVYEDCNWASLVNGSLQTPYYLPGKTMFERCKNLLGDIAATYYLAEAASKMLRGQASTVGQRHEIESFLFSVPAWHKMYLEESNSDFKADMQCYNILYTGVYRSVGYSRPNGEYYPRTQGSSKWSETARDTVMIQVPMYQFPLVFGGTFNHGGNTKKFALHESMPSITGSSRVHQDISSKMFFRAVGGAIWQKFADQTFRLLSWDDVGIGTNGVKHNVEVFDAAKALEHVKKVQVLCYRVNAYNYNTGLFTYDEAAKNNVNGVFTSWEDYPFKNKNWKNDGTTFTTQNR